MSFPGIVFFYLISEQTYAAVLVAACGEYHLFSCRFQLTVEVFDYMDAELKLADTGENKPSSLLSNTGFFNDGKAELFFKAAAR